MKRHLLAFIVPILLTITLLTQSSTAFSQNKKHPVSGEQSSGAGQSDARWQAEALKYLDATDYFFKEIPGYFAFANKKQELTFATNGTLLKILPINGQQGTARNNWESSMTLTAVGDRPFEPGIEPVNVEAVGQYLKFNYPDFAVEYLNKDYGLRQNFIINNKPQGVSRLSVTLSFAGDLHPVLSKTNVLTLAQANGGAKIIQYDDLKVWDKNHRVLPAQMRLTADNELIIDVNDDGAVYPVTIDPLTHTPDWTTSADGVLPGLLNNLQLQVDALYGYKVAGVGDVNNDGFDDVAVGAPAAVDIIAGPATVVGAGAVFLYFGSAAGLPVVPSRILRATTPVTNALFGMSIAAGNVTGSTVFGLINRDIIVGAPGDTYLADVAGSIPQVSVTAGKVYVFDGAQLQAGPATPLLSLYLNGAGLLSNGLLGLGTNVNVKALFGFSVAATEDMDGDGRGEVIVGAPAYKGIQLLDVNSGAAFVYRSGNLLLNSATQLSAPTLLGFPGLLNLDGLLFGFSVDGLGDYNLDTRPDVVVGAPGGLNLGVSGFLGGSAYVFTGNGVGVNSTISTQLTASGPLLGAVANLFGYDVKGVRNAAGVRTGNVLVGAPAGSVLSNVLGGLRLKTGNVYVFAAEASPSATELPLQGFSSPRGANLLAQLLSVNIDVSALFGASLDNMRDVNCDGIGDLIVGEPLSTGVGLVNADAIGGAAFVFTGNANGTYNTTPFWSLQHTVVLDFGINAGSLLGYSVAGGGYTSGPFESVRALVGAPGKALDFGASSLLNLGNTVGTLFSFVAGNNGLGKAYAFSFNCRFVTHPDIGATYVNVPLNGNTNTNDEVPANAQYGTPTAAPTNPPGAILNVNPDGTYTFTATTVGVYVYGIQVCTPNGDCLTSLLTITVLSPSLSLQPPVANTDIATTAINTAVTVNTLHNDEAGYIGGTLNPASVIIVNAPDHGTTSINPSTGAITYTPANNYTGQDTLVYQVCDNSSPTPLCAFAIQIFTVQAAATANTTLAADDFNYIAEGNIATGNVMTNDTDAEGNTQVVTAQNITVPGVGTFILSTTGVYSFSPAANFTGPASFPYTTCDNGTPGACASATVHILVLPLSTTPVDITEFSAQPQSCTARLTWKTNAEIAVARFEIEVSTDNGRTFSTVGSATARGNNSTYSFTHPMKNEYAHLYRLKVVDISGSISYSDLVNLRKGCASGKMESYVFPSPATNVLNLTIADASILNTDALLFDMNGKRIQAVKITSAMVKVNVSALTPGIYLVKLSDGTTMKFIKQ